MALALHVVLPQFLLATCLKSMGLAGCACAALVKKKQAKDSQGDRPGLDSGPGRGDLPAAHLAGT